MELFTYQMNPSRIVFGSGTINWASSELSRLKLLLSTPSRTPQIQDLAKVLEARSITPTGVFTEATMHTPVAVTEKAVAEAQAAGSDCVISLGGGSTIGLGKAISARTGLYHLCIPTTCSMSGSIIMDEYPSWGAYYWKVFLKVVANNTSSYTTTCAFRVAKKCHQ
jgi:alcohol dehydrogenase class IV